ncbi:uncharacterized protein LOC132178236 [Corylus avellana]|uniref:uncharacterized protein LOC132178236 n=1 Tax=Corylus avellana TaxID=13451 RepID=UPI00286AE32A|nr:uncharacterized protein LOC132178236 [Corylus avellana]
MDSYSSALEKTVMPTNVDAISSSSHWQNPPSGWVKANWDAGVNQRTGRVGLGVVIRDHHGKMWVARSLTRLGFMDHRAAETLAASMAVKLGTEMGFRKIQLEGDAKVEEVDTNKDGIEWGEFL